jgi:hypothetical protein
MSKDQDHKITDNEVKAACFEYRRRNAFVYNSPQYLQIKEKLDAWASEAEDFEDGVLVDVHVPLKWWKKTHIRDLPLKIVYHADSKKLFAIEINGDPLFNQTERKGCSF